MATRSPDIDAPDASIPVPARPGSDPVAHTLALLQPWIDYVPQQQRRLGFFIILALLLHVATFFFIRIDATRAELRHQTRVRVAVENTEATSVDTQPVDLYWDRLNDPRLFLLPLRPMAGFAADAPSLDFTSITANIGSAELPPPAAPEDYRLSVPAVTPLERRVEEAMQPPRQPFSYDETPPAIATGTVWSWDDALARRRPAAAPDLPPLVSDTDLSPTVLRLAVRPDGAVEHAFVEQSSDDQGAPIAKDLDQQAVLAARKIRFQPVDKPGLVWGRVTIFWRYSAKPRIEVVPTPPSGP